MTEAPQLTSFDGEEQQLYSELHQDGDTIDHNIIIEQLNTNGITGLALQ